MNHSIAAPESAGEMLSSLSAIVDFSSHDFPSRNDHYRRMVCGRSVVHPHVLIGPPEELLVLV